MTSDQTKSPTEATQSVVVTHPRNWAAHIHPGFALVLAGVLVPGFCWFALGALIVVLDWIARSHGIAEGSLPHLAALLLVLPAAGTVFTVTVLLTLLFPDGRRLLGRSNPDRALRRRYTWQVLCASVTPFLIWTIVMLVADPFMARSTRESWGWIVEVLAFACYGLTLLAGLIFIARLPFRLLVRCAIGAAYVALVGFLLFPFTVGVAISISGEAL
jgi:hypothetical protein